MAESSKQKCIQVQEFGYAGIKYAEINKPDPSKLQEGDFIVKVIASPLAPLDYWKLNGKVPGMQCPLILGTEGYGEITACPTNQDLIGKKVAFLGKNGGMQEYAIGNVGAMVVVGQGVDEAVSACGFVNPLTCLGMFERVNQLGAQAIVSTAGNSQVGRMIIRYAKEKGIKVISICRGQPNVKELKEKEGAEFVFDFQEEGFAEKFKEAAKEVNATVCLDSLAGDLAGILYNNMPQNSVLICYGSVLGPMNGIDGFQVRLFQYNYLQDEMGKQENRGIYALSMVEFFGS